MAAAKSRMREWEDPEQDARQLRRLEKQLQQQRKEEDERLAYLRKHLEPTLLEQFDAKRSAPDLDG